MKKLSLSIISILSFALLLACFSVDVHAKRFQDRDWEIGTGTGTASTATRISPQTVGRFWLQIYGGDAYLLKNATPNIGEGIKISDGGSIDFEDNTLKYTDYWVYISENNTTHNYITTQ